MLTPDRACLSLSQSQNPKNISLYLEISLFPHLPPPFFCIVQYTRANGRSRLAIPLAKVTPIMCQLGRETGITEENTMMKVGLSHPHEMLNYIVATR